MSDSTGLAQVAGLFGHLLLREIGEEMLRMLQSEEVAAAMQTLGVPTPQDDQLDALAAEYCAAFIGPKDPRPLIQSLYEGGGHEAPSANAVREIATNAGFELDRDKSRAAAPDHLGAILMLWAELADPLPDHAALLAHAHMTWALAPLQDLALRDGFYGKLATAVSGVIDAIVTPDVDG